jgi:hypothetical protein
VFIPVTFLVFLSLTRSICGILSFDHRDKRPVILKDPESMISNHATIVQLPFPHVDMVAGAADQYSKIVKHDLGKERAASSPVIGRKEQGETG